MGEGLGVLCWTGAIFFSEGWWCRILGLEMGTNGVEFRGVVVFRVGIRASFGFLSDGHFSC